MTPTVAAHPPLASVGAGAILNAGLTGGAIAAAANLALYAVARLAGVEFVARFDPHAAASALPFFMPAVSSLVPSVFAALVMLGLTKALARPAVPFAVLSGVLAIVSCGAPLTLAEASPATQIVLAVMHLIAGAAIVAPLMRVASRAS